MRIPARCVAIAFLAAAAVLAASDARGNNHVTGVPQLSSRPGATYTVYLDFPGFNFAGTWAFSGAYPMTVPAYDNATSSFSSAEQTAIKQIWAGVSEAYSLFNINVTTVDPAPGSVQSSDFSRQAWYDQTPDVMHTIMMPNNSWYGAGGGVTYTTGTIAASTYSTSGNGGAGYGFKTNWDFLASLSFGVQTSAGAATHENGHSFNLSHQSDYVGSTFVNQYSGGDAKYAPFMGNPYTTQRGEWRLGDSPNGTTYIQNDIAQILTNPGMSLVDDGIGHSRAAATPLPLSGANANFNLAKGVIIPNSSTSPTPIGASNYFSDYYAFQSNGTSPITLKVNDGTEYLTPGAADPIAMLRSTLTILNGSGQTVGTGTEAASTLSETFNGVLPAGTYYAQIASYGGYTQTLYSGTGSTNFNTTYYYDAGPYFLTGSGFAAYIWANPVSGSWTTPSNWLSNSVPNAQAIDVVINAATNNPLTITLDGPQTVGSLVLGNSLNNATGYTLSPGANGTLTFNNSGSAATITVTDGSHAISAPATLAGSLIVSVSANATLSVSSNIGQSAVSGLTLYGPGKLVLSGNDSYSGGTGIEGGVLQAGSNSALGASTGGLEIDAGTFDVHGYSVNVGLLNGGGTIDNLSGNGSLTIGNGNASTPIGPFGPFFGTIQDSVGQLSLLKVGGGTISILGNITLSGSIGVNNGFLTEGTGANVQASTFAADGGSYSLSNGGLHAGNEYIGYSARGSFTESGGTHVVSTELDLAYEPGSSGSYNLNGSGLLLTNTANIGFFGNGIFTQSGGTHTVACLNLSFSSGVGYSGSYSLSGNGRLSATNENIGYIGNGSFTQLGGNHAVSNTLDLGDNGGSYGSYNLSGGSLFAASENVAYYGNGGFTQSGGTHTVAGVLTFGTGVNTSGSYSLSGGSLSASATYIGNGGTGGFTQSGGVFTAGNLYLTYKTNSSGSYNLSGTGVLNIPTGNSLFVGNSGSATFSQSGGTVNLVGNALLNVGCNPGSSGTYLLSGSGVINNLTYDEFIGQFGAGSFTQSGGINNANNLYVGESTWGGAYALSQGVLTTTGSEFIGAFGPGSFAQIGGTHSAGKVYLGYYSGSSGTYSLGGGTLACSQITGGAGSSTFYFNGGVLQATASNSNFMSGLTAAYVEYNGALINTNGQNITIAQPLLNGSGGGSLEKFGAGALTLTAANTYTNGTILYGGTLVAANSAGSALGSGPLLPEGGVLAAGPAGGTISGPVLAEGAPYTIDPGATLSPGYGTLNLNGGLAATSYTKLLFNINTASVLGTGGNGLNIYGGDLLNFNGGTLNVGGGQIALVNTPTATGDYRLVDDATLTSGAASVNNFILPGQSGVSYALSTTIDSGYIDLVVGVGNAGASGGTWTHSGNGSWATGSFWSGGLFPSSGTATLGAPGGTITVTLDGYRTAGALVFVNGFGGYTLSQGTGGALTLGTSAGASIAVNSGASIISAPLQMAGNLAVGVAGGASLQLSGPLSESTTGTSFTFNGPGLLNYSAVGTFTGNTSVNGGTLQIAAPGYLPAAFEYVANGTVIQTGGSNVASKDIYFGYFAYASGTLSGGQMSAPSEYFGYGALCDFVQTGGTNAVSSTLTIADVSSFQASSYTLSGNGQINATNETFGLYGHANFIQNGGNNQVYYSLTIGTNSGVYPYANYFLNSGNLSAFIETIGVSGNGDILQAGGNNSVAWEMDVGYNSTSTASYFLGGGSLSVPMEYIGYNGTGVFTQNGGTNSVASTQTTPVLDLGYQATGNGSYALSGSGLLSVGFHEYIGDNGTGSFTQSGGTHTVYGDLLLGNNAGSSGSYLLSSGLLYAGVGGNATEYIGNSGSGSFTQTGGNHIVSGILSLGSNAGGSGTFNLQGGNLSSVDEDIGLSGNGSFTQSGGVNAVQYSLFLGTNGGSGTYSLSGNGQLSALYEFIAAPPDTGMYSGTGVFLQTGGTNLAGTLWLGYQDGYSGTYNLNGGLLSVSNGVTSGSGTGTLNLDGGMLEMNGNSINVGAFSAMSGVLSDVGGITSGGTQGLVKSQSVSGNNVLVLSGVNTYSGPTTVNAGMLVAASGPMISATSIGNVTLNGGTLAVGAAGGMISGPVLAGSGPHTIAPGAALSSGYGTLTLNGGLSTNNYTTLAFNLNLSSSIGSGVNGLPIYGGDLIDMGSSTLTVMGGSITFAINPTAAGDYRLIANAGGSPVLGNFSLPSQIGWKYSLSTTDDTGFIDAVASAVALTGGTWTFNGSGSWSVGSNWSSNPNIPNGDTVTFPDVAGTTAPITVTLDGNQSAGDLVFNVSTTNGYTLSQGTGGALTLGTGAGASITVLGGAHTISAPLVMAGNLAVSTAAGTSLQLSGALSESTSGSALSFGGAGQVIFSGTGSYTGDTTVSAGTLQLLPGGMLPAANEYVGSSGSASLIQSGGSNVVSASLYLGNNPGDSGTYNLSGGVLFCANTEAIGVAGIGSVTQSGGTNSAGTLVLAQSSNSSGSYNLNGGLLSLSALNQGSGAAAFNIGIGTFQAASNFSTSVPMNLSAAGSSGVFDTNGNLLTLAGPLSGPGGLQVIGSGALTLAVSNSYTGTTLVSNGTLLLGDSNALSGSTFDSSGSGALSFGSSINAFVFGGLQGSGSLALTDVSGTDVTLTVGGNNANTTFSGNLSDLNGLGSLTKVGTGTLVLSGSNSYGAGTAVLDGTLILTNSEAITDVSSLTVGDPSMFPAPVVPSLAGSPVPEPGTLVLLAAGAALMAIYRKWRERSN